MRGSPQKARLVIDMIRGKNVAQALAILQFTNKRATENIEKCLRSAIANATFKAEQDNVAIDPDDLWVKTCFVDMGPTKNRRRVRPAPQGRAYREQRYYCHVTIHVTSVQPENAKIVGKVKRTSINAKPANIIEVKSAETAPVDSAAGELNNPPRVETFNDLPESDRLGSESEIESSVNDLTIDSTETRASDETVAEAANVETPAKNETESTSEEKKTD